MIVMEHLTYTHILIKYMYFIKHTYISIIILVIFVLEYNLIGCVTMCRVNLYKLFIQFSLLSIIAFWGEYLYVD